MDYDSFKIDFLVELRRRLGPALDIHIEGATDNRPEGITMIPEPMKGRPFPIVGLKEIYADFKSHGENMDYIVRSALHVFASLWQQAPEYPDCKEGADDSTEPDMHLKCIGSLGPIDIWEGSFEVDGDVKDEVLSLMPEPPRSNDVYLTYLPNPEWGEMQPLFMCKADNNGTVYLFAETDIVKEGLLHYEPLT